MNSVQKIIDLFGGFPFLKDDYIRLEVPGYMRLVIEQIGTGPHGLPLLSVAHYGEQNGDAMRDPDMTFEIDQIGEWHPVSFRNDYVGVEQEAVFLAEDGRIMVRPRLVKELTAFAKIWNRNISEQGYIKAARQQIAQRTSV